MTCYRQPLPDNCWPKTIKQECFRASDTEKRLELLAWNVLEFKSIIEDTEVHGNRVFEELQKSLKAVAELRLRIRRLGVEYALLRVLVGLYLWLIMIV